MVEDRRVVAVDDQARGEALLAFRQVAAEHHVVQPVPPDPARRQWLGALHPRVGVRRHAGQAAGTQLVPAGRGHPADAHALMASGHLAVDQQLHVQGHAGQHAVTPVVVHHLHIDQRRRRSTADTQQVTAYQASIAVDIEELVLGADAKEGVGNIDRCLAEHFEQQQHVVMLTTVGMLAEVTVGARKLRGALEAHVVKTYGAGQEYFADGGAMHQAARNGVFVMRNIGHVGISLMDGCRHFQKLHFNIAASCRSHPLSNSRRVFSVFP